MSPSPWTPLSPKSLIPAISAGPEKLTGKYTQNVNIVLTFRYLVTDSWSINLLSALVPLVWNWWIKKCVTCESWRQKQPPVRCHQTCNSFIFSNVPSLCFLQPTPLNPPIYLPGPLHFVILLSDLIQTHEPSLKSLFSMSFYECTICRFYNGRPQDSTFKAESIIS